MNTANLLARYTLFCLVASISNIGMQRVTFDLFGNEHHLIPALFAGTLTGLLIKYHLDKRWIFLDKTKGLGANSHKFARYGLAGVFTTGIFWLFEILFWVIWHTETMRDIGALLGLCIGYTIKYNFDRKFVFKKLNC